MSQPTKTRSKNNTVTMKGVKCAKCGCKKFRPLASGSNGVCVHCGAFTILWGAYPAWVLESMIHLLRRDSDTPSVLRCAILRETAEAALRQKTEATE